MIIKNIKGKYKIIKEPKNLEGQTCINCDNIASEKHHMISGRAYRHKCEVLGLTIALCRRCHYLIHNKPKEKDLYRFYKRVAQEMFEKHLGSHEDWMNIFNKNYL